jgi:uncharacterized protein (DUF302 family)
MYGFTITLTGLSFDEAIVKTTAALKAEGFGILSDIDVQHAMKEKLGKDMPPYHILGLATRRWRTRRSRQCRTSACCCRAT